MSTHNAAAADDKDMTTRRPIPGPRSALASRRDPDRLGTLLGVAQGWVIGAAVSISAGLVLDLPVVVVIGAVHGLAGTLIWWRTFGFALTVPVEMRTWSNDGTRPLARHEERRWSRKLARQYSHDVMYRYGPCWRDARPFSWRRLRRSCCPTCWRRSLEGTYGRRREAMDARRKTAPVVDLNALRRSPNEHDGAVIRVIRKDGARHGGPDGRDGLGELGERGDISA